MMLIIIEIIKMIYALSNVCNETRQVGAWKTWEHLLGTNIIGGLLLSII